ncbi:MAG: exodeoxyribonuclease VII large subunit [Defluviitaleaceae bacterium]|nr:exodeoxyribonuclease VII large subunit [Defluviitaleaceae bacterium]
MPKTIFSVTQINRYVKKSLDSDVLLSGLFVEGEISNYNLHSSGHMYFTLKDAASAIPAVMFRSHTADLSFSPKNGNKVVAFGRVSLYEKTGQYQLYAEFLQPSGIGGLQLAFVQLKEKLEAQGLFSQERKRPIPRYPKCVAVVTSPTGAAVRDIITTIREINRAVQILVVPAIVQGETAASDLVRAINEVNEHAQADTIILGRGGGSIEDLWAFNEEKLARAIAASKIPIISAVGHETDFTIADFVADYRAATPTAAAQIAVYDQAYELENLQDLQAALCRGLSANINARTQQIKTSLADLSRAANERIAREKTKLTHTNELLEKVSPYTVFKRGYALVQGEKAVITSTKNLAVGQNIYIRFADGTASAEITSIMQAT